MIKNDNEKKDPPRIERVCSELKVMQTSSESNILCFNAKIRTNGVFEFPHLHMKEIIKLITVSDTERIVHHHNSFTKITGNYPSMDFCIDHQFPGTFNFTVECNFDPVYKEEGVLIEDINYNNTKISHVTANEKEMLVLTDFA